MKVKKLTALFLSLLLVVSTAACANSGGATSNSDTAGDPKTTEKTETTDTAEPADPIKLTCWVNEQHTEIFEYGAELYNEEHPNNPIELSLEFYPVTEMHNKLLIALQSGVGAPDIVDINLTWWSNFMQGDIQLVPLNDIVEPELDHMVSSRFELYSKDGSYYGIPTHVGATCMYYNMDLIKQAGVTVEEIDEIETWDQYLEIGRRVTDATGMAWTAYETLNQRPYWPLLNECGLDYIDADGNVTMDNEENINVLEWMYDVFQEGLATEAPGGDLINESFYNWMNGGNCASLLMPSWYMIRLMDYMPDLYGKMIVRPVPVFEEGQPRSTCVGGTPTAITSQCKHIEEAKELLYWAKLSDKGSINIWETCKFDPVNLNVWTDASLTEPMDYFSGESFFEIMMPYIENGIPSPINPSDEKSTTAQELMRNNVMYQVFVTQEKSPEQALTDAANEVRNLKN
ncbi:L-arabinose-binding protein [Lachnospiraceae bacterium NLAE-zl-G231]|nr:L-arabinose-binding protein [Lachnospiraceae bacterium NLAE-zl-G231]